MGDAAASAVRERGQSHISHPHLRAIESGLDIHMWDIASRWHISHCSSSEGMFRKSLVRRFRLVMRYQPTLDLP